MGIFSGVRKFFQKAHDLETEGMRRVLRWQIRMLEAQLEKAQNMRNVSPAVRQKLQSDVIAARRKLNDLG